MEKERRIKIAQIKNTIFPYDVLAEFKRYSIENPKIKSMDHIDSSLCRCIFRIRSQYIKRHENPIISKILIEECCPYGICIITMVIHQKGTYMTFPQLHPVSREREVPSFSSETEYSTTRPNKTEVLCICIEV